MSKPLDLVGLAEISEWLGVSKQAVTNWRGRHDNFPAPIAELKSGPVWLRSEVSIWAEAKGMEVASREPAASGTRACHRPNTVAFTNMKGGVGKSTLAANIGWYCAYQKDKRVLLVDLDPQFNLSQYVLGNEGYENHLDSKKPTIVDILERFTPIVIAGNDRSDLSPMEAISGVRRWDDGSLIDLVPSRLELAWTLKHSTDKAHVLRDFLQDIKNQYDLILIDCPPTESILTTASYMASDYLLVPVKPEFLSTIGLPLLVKSLSDFKKLHKNESHPKLAGIVFNDTGDKVEHDRSRKFVAKVAKRQRWYVFKNEVSHSDSYPAGARSGTPIFLTDYARHWKKTEFRRVAEEFISRIGM